MRETAQRRFLYHLTFAAAAALALALACGAPARAACPGVDSELAAAQSALRDAEPAHDASPADLERRLQLVATAFADEREAETIRTTTAGGCSDLQQVYDVMLTEAWAKLVLAYLKPSLDFFVTDPSCLALSRVETNALVAGANETMQRSLISWYPVQPLYTIERDHVSALAPAAAAYLHIDLPGPDGAEDFARRWSYGYDVARSRETLDCAALVSDPNIPKAVLAIVFAGD